MIKTVTILMEDGSHESVKVLKEVTQPTLFDQKPEPHSLFVELPDKSQKWVDHWWYDEGA